MLILRCCSAKSHISLKEEVIMFLESDKDIETYRETFHSGLRSKQIYGYVGKIRKSAKASTFSFYVTNRRHYFRNTREWVGGRLPVFVYAYGKASAASSGVTVQAGFWYGAPVWELLLYYVGTFLLMLCAKVRYDISLPVVALSALGLTLFFVLFSVACSGLTLLGSDDRRELEEYLTRTLELDDL